MKIPSSDARVHLLNEQSDVWSIIREIVNKTNQEDAFYVMDVGEIVKKHNQWVSQLPRVTPHYGKQFWFLFHAFSSI